MRKIIHIDMDYFFVQVEELGNPKLKNLPVAIGSRKYKRGVLSTANYHARKFGVKSAMPTGLALRLCPDLVLVPGQYHKYKEASKKIFEIIYRYSSKVQALSIDEAYIDVTECELFDNDAIAIAKSLREAILNETGLTASAGVSYNKLLAKIASDLNKPNGLSVIRPDDVARRIAHFNVSKINGVGKVMQEKLKKLGIQTFGDLQSFKKIQLIQYFGDYGVTLYNYCRGIDEREVKSNSERKSLSLEHTYAEDLIDKKQIMDKIELAFDELLLRLKKYKNRRIKNIHLKLKYNDFTQTTVEQLNQTQNLVLEEFIDLLEKRLIDNKLIKPVRLVGVGVKFFCSKSSKGQIEMTI